MICFKSNPHSWKITICWNLLDQHVFPGCTSNHAFGDIFTSKRRDEIRVYHFGQYVGLSGWTTVV